MKLFAMVGAMQAACEERVSDNILTCRRALVVVGRASRAGAQATAGGASAAPQ
jgi:hypothetical protein